MSETIIQAKDVIIKLAINYPLTDNPAIRDIDQIGKQMFAQFFSTY